MTMLKALADFTVEIDGELILIEKGKTRVSSSHPLLADCRHLFEPVRGRGGDSDTRTVVRALDATGQLIETRKEAKS
jgi:hypothetical protein